MLRKTKPHALLISLCAAVTLPAAAQERSDTVVRQAGPPRFQNARVTTELTIGSVEGAAEYLFADITEILVAKDGTIWVLEGSHGSPQLRQYDRAGTYLRTIGRRGGGPGEFREPTGMAQLKDGRVLLRDLAANRINVYMPDGKPDTTWVFSTAYSWPTGGRDGVRVDTAGFVWMPFMRPSTNPDLLARLNDPAAFVRLRADGSMVDTISAPVLPEISRPSVIVTSAGGRGRTVFRPPFQPVAFWWWSRNGYFITGITSRYHIDLRIPGTRRDAGVAATRVRRPASWLAGDPVVSIRLNTPHAILSATERRENQARLDFDVNRREGTRSSPIPEVPRTKPAFRYVDVAEDGRTWVNVYVASEQFDPPTPETRPGQPSRPVVRWRDPIVYDVFEAGGTYVGRVALPAGTYPRVFDGDVIWSVFRDPDGVNFVKKFRVVWR